MIALIIALTLTFDVYQETVITSNPDPDWVPQTYEEWISGEPSFESLEIREIIGSDASVKILIVLEENLSDSIGIVLLEQWVADMGSQGLSAEVIEVTYSEPAELREYFAEQYETGLEGAVLIGNLPVAWCALDATKLYGTEQFPADYFFMDLDGIWEDLWIGYPSQGNPGQDNKYDTWSGDLDPEIYVGRIKTNTLSVIADPIEMIQAYLERNHTWRLYGDPEPLNALCYVDDDWAGFGPGYQNSMMLLYSNVELVNDLLATNGTDYRDNRLPANYVWISPYVHSGPTSHSWEPGPNTFWNDIIPANPQARFYNLFACSNARFTTTRNMGSIYALATSSGLASIGSTKSGSMLHFSHFYNPLGMGSSMGEAYQDWWDFIAIGGVGPIEMGWHLGMVLIGDPTLMPAMHMLGIEGGAPASGTVPVLSIYPNPCAGVACVKTELVAGDTAVLSLFDISGRVVMREIISRTCERELDLSDLDTGIYLVRVRTGAGMEAAGTLVNIR